MHKGFDETRRLGLQSETEQVATSLFMLYTQLFIYLSDIIGKMCVYVANLYSYYLFVHFFMSSIDNLLHLAFPCAYDT